MAYYLLYALLFFSLFSLLPMRRLFKLEMNDNHKDDNEGRNSPHESLSRDDCMMNTIRRPISLGNEC